jgi:hypothetical protein
MGPKEEMEETTLYSLFFFKGTVDSIGLEDAK